MQYELRTQVIEPPRNTFTHLVKRYGDRPASRYEEGSIDIQPKENFHYRPLWDPEHELYDETYSDFRLTDPYSFTDPRQYYYAPYVTSRAAMADAVASTLDYLGSRDLLSRLPDAWSALHRPSSLVPLRHYESGAQMISCDVTRFGFGTTITQCAVVRGVRPDRQRAGAQPGRHRPRRWHRRAARRGEDPLGRRRLAAGPAPLHRGAVPGEGLGQGAHPARRARPASLRPVLHRTSTTRPSTPAQASYSLFAQHRPPGSRTSASGSTPSTRRGSPTRRPAPRTRRCSPRPPPRRSTPRSSRPSRRRGPGRRARRCRCRRSTSRPLPPPCATPSRR